MTPDDSDRAEEYESALEYWATRSRVAETQSANMRMMLLRLSKNPTRYSGEEIRAALKRWGVKGDPLRGANETEDPQ